MWIAIKSVRLTLIKPPSQKSRANFNTNIIAVQTLPVFNITLTKRRCKYDIGTCYWAINDWKGSTRSVVSFSQEGNISASGNAFIYPSGVMASAMPGSQIDRRHQDKRWISDNGLNLYDNCARFYDPILGRFYSMDPLAPKYSQLTPYSMAAANPASYCDLQGDSIAVLKADMHVAILIQNREGKWEYFSVNGNKQDFMWANVIKLGRGYNCVGVNHGWTSPEDFIADTSYNSSGISREDDSVSGMKYTDYVVLPTTANQDDLIRESMTESCFEEYRLLDQNCTTAVFKALEAGRALPLTLGAFNNLYITGGISWYAMRNEPDVFFNMLKSSVKLEKTVPQLLLNFLDNQCRR